MKNVEKLNFWIKKLPKMVQKWPKMAHFWHFSTFLITKIEVCEKMKFLKMTEFCDGPEMVSHLSPRAQFATAHRK